MSIELDVVNIKSRWNEISGKWMPSMLPASHYGGDSAVGYTLEKLYGVKENNFTGSDLPNFEIKTAKENSNSSQLTLFCLEPSIGSTKKLWEKFGSDTLSERTFEIKKRFFLDLKSHKRNKYGLSINGNEETIQVIWGKRLLCEWKVDDILFRLKQKLKNLFMIYAIENGKKIKYDRATLYYNISVKAFLNLLLIGDMSISFRCSENENGNFRNRGTAFRMKKSDVHKLYEIVEKI